MSSSTSSVQKKKQFGTMGARLPTVDMNIQHEIPLSEINSRLKFLENSKYFKKSRNPLIGELSPRENAPYLIPKDKICKEDYEKAIRLTKMSNLKRDIKEYNKTRVSSNPRSASTTMLFSTSEITLSKPSTAPTKATSTLSSTFSNSTLNTFSCPNNFPADAESTDSPYVFQANTPYYPSFSAVFNSSRPQTSSATSKNIYYKNTFHNNIKTTTFSSYNNNFSSSIRQRKNKLDQERAELHTQLGGISLEDFDHFSIRPY